MNLKDREKIMKQWDSWHKYIADGGKASWPRDAFEALLDSFQEKYEDLREALIILLESCGCYGKKGIEIPAELSAQFDITIDDAQKIIKIFEQLG